MPSKDFAARRNPAIAGCTATGVLKILALVFMFIDHAGKMLFPQIAEMRMLGRIAFPLYCWCMVVGISYTRSVPKYLGRLMLIGLVSQPIYMVALNHSWNQPNIFLTLLVALCGVTGALLHTLNHSLFKSLLFFGAGNILSQTHTTSLDALGGLAKHMPLTAILFLTGTAAICALPPLNGFVSELLIYLGMLDGIASGSNVLASAAGLAGASSAANSAHRQSCSMAWANSWVSSNCMDSSSRPYNPVTHSSLPEAMSRTSLTRTGSLSSASSSRVRRWS